jgi:S-DNA-T family DNA segregation ATPase FtsK/SpoIIIE
MMLTTDRPPEGNLLQRARARLVGLLLSIPPWLATLIKAGPRGLGKVLAAAFHFARDERRAARIDDMAGTGHARQLIEEEIHQRAMKIRSALVVLPPVGLAAAVYLGWFVMPWWQWTIAGTITWLLCGLVGLPEDAPKVPSVVYMDAGEPKITENLIIDALAACGIPRLTAKIEDGRERGYQAVRFHDTPHRDGTGIAASLTLPAGVTVDQVNDDGRRKAFAGGLERSEERILITRGEHEARLRLFVADHALRDLDTVQWELLPKRGAVKPFDIFGPIPVGVDLYGRSATISAYRPVDGATFGIVAGMTGSGKTVSGRLVPLAAALDPTVELHLYDFKGGSDWEELGPAVSHVYRSGQSIADVEALVDDLDTALDEIGRRNDARKALRLAEPDLYRGGYSRQLASRKDLGFQPILFVIDEPFPFVVDKSNKAQAKVKQRARHLLYEVGRQGRSVGVGIMVLLQTVKDDTIPKVFSDNASLRICFRAANADAVNQALGDGAAGRGYRADRLGPNDKGVGYIGGEGVEINMARFASVVDIDDLETIATAARQFRLDTGRLSGMAAGELEPDDHHPDILDHTATVWPPDGPQRLAYAELLELLAGRYHGDYQRLLNAGDETTIGKRLRAAGADTVQITAGPLKGRKGVRLADILAAIDTRNADRMADEQDNNLDNGLDTQDTHDGQVSGEMSSRSRAPVPGRFAVAEPGESSSGNGHG